MTYQEDCDAGQGALHEEAVGVVTVLVLHPAGSEAGPLFQHILRKPASGLQGSQHEIRVQELSSLCLCIFAEHVTGTPVRMLQCTVPP